MYLSHSSLRACAALAWLSLLAFAGCGDEPTQEDGNNAASPCGDACPVEQCVFASCVEDNSGTPDADVDVEPDAQPDAEPDAPPDARPDADVEPDADFDADADAPEGGPCVQDLDCPERQRCDLEEEVCVPGCQTHDECGPPESRLLCDPGTGRCVAGPCRTTEQCLGGQYCDLESFPTACLEGCDVGTCPRGEFCDLERRQCFGGCQVDTDCADPETWCEAASARCLPGCRLDGCAVGQDCVEFDSEEGQDPARLCLSAACDSDEGCGADEFCGVEPIFGRQVCQLGCRTEPDSCGEGQRCNEGARVCREVLPSACSEEAPCPNGSRCEGGACVLGCVVDEDCADGQRCDAEAGVCSCVGLGDCSFGQVCHEARCAQECLGVQNCSEEGLVCDQQARVCLVGCVSDENCDSAQGLVCDVGRQRCVRRGCDEDEACPNSQYCDQVEGRCAPGCRAGGCPGVGRTCDPASRLCVDGCALDAECAEGSFCGEGACVVGCRGDEECGVGERCVQTVSEDEAVSRACITAPCLGDVDCGEGEYCLVDPESGAGVCEAGCRLDGQGCPSGVACSPQTRQCSGGPCSSDGLCPEGWICDLLIAGGTCRPGCRDGALCAPDQACLLERQACSCTGDENCGEGEICELGSCERGCVSNADCQEEGARCDVRERRCVVSCVSDAECASLGLICNVARGVCDAPVCEVDADCGEGLYCDETGPSGGRCAVGCREGGCPRGQTCLLSDRSCAQGCGADNDCEGSEFCDPDARECRPGCRSDEACPEGQVCDAGLVGGAPGRVCGAPSCDTSAQCDQGFYCGVDPQSQRRVCLAGCRVEPDSCGVGQRCNAERQCVASGCASDQACGVGEICEGPQGSKACRVGCRANAGCANGAACDLGSLTCECSTNEDCRSGQRCEGGACVEGCSSDAQCGDDEICDITTRACRPGCRTDNECVAGQACDFASFTCIGRRCRGDVECPAGNYCSNDEVRRCEVGCRQGGCLSGFTCDLETRACIQGCNRDNDCLAGFFCNTEERQCRFGCRNRADCLGQDCVELRPNGDIQRLCLPPRCAEDADCEDEAYCRPDDGLGLSLCTVGCRLGLGGCSVGEVCDAQTRVCGLVVCGQDAECARGQICEPLNGANVCQTGCRRDDACELRSCDLNQKKCACAADEDCLGSEICDLGACRDRCYSDLACAQGQTCNTDTGRCVEACASDEPCLVQGQRCDADLGRCADVLCDADEVCPEGAWCDLAQPAPYCRLGCRAGGCPDGLFCDTTSRLCLAGCEDDASCPDGQRCASYEDEGVPVRACVQACVEDAACEDSEYCGIDPTFGVEMCQPGCRTTPGGCPDGLVCNSTTRQCGGATCQRDDQCGARQICAEGSGSCEPGCRANNQCAQGESCNNVITLCTCDANADCDAGQVCDGAFCVRACANDAVCGLGLACEAGLCVLRCDDDMFEPNNNVVDAQPLGALSASGLSMCFLEGSPFAAQDCYTAQLSAGSYEASLSFLQAEGNLNLEVYDPDLALVGLSSGAGDGEIVGFDAVAGLYTFCAVPAGFFFASTYDLSVERR